MASAKLAPHELRRGKHTRRLLKAGVAGTSTSHGGENNVHKINLLLKQDSSTTFGMEELLRGQDSRRLTRLSPISSDIRQTTKRIRGGGA